MANHFTAADIRQIRHHALFTDTMSASLYLYRVTLSLGFLTDSRQYARFELDNLINRAKTDASTWRSTPDKLFKLHREFQNFVDEFVRVTEQLSRAPGTPDSVQLVDLAVSRSHEFLNAFHQQQVTARHLAAGTYTVLPRLVDYMYSNVYLFAQRMDMLSKGTSITIGPAHQRLTASFRVAPDAVSAYRFSKALKFIDTYRAEYALAYAAYSNLTAHFARLKHRTADSVAQALALRDTDKTHRRKARAELLRVSLRAIQRESAEVIGLLGRH
jgi:hypothetical protein